MITLIHSSILSFSHTRSYLMCVCVVDDLCVVFDSSYVIIVISDTRVTDDTFVVNKVILENV